jgi:hypothetical protein
MPTRPSAAVPGRREVRPLAQLGDAQLHRAGPYLPVSVPIPCVLDQTLDAHLVIDRSGHAALLIFHQALGPKPIILRNKSASAIFSISAPRLIISSVIADFSGSGLVVATFFCSTLKSVQIILNKNCCISFEFFS